MKATYIIETSLGEVKIPIEYDEVNKNVTDFTPVELEEEEKPTLDEFIRLDDGTEIYDYTILGAVSFYVARRREIEKWIKETELKNSIIEGILTRKVDGIDCTETESTEIKGFFRENWGDTDFVLMQKVKANFPLEYAELEELEETDAFGNSELSPIFYVDIPKVNGNGKPSEEWYNVESFKSREEAIKFAMEHFGADEEGNVSLISQS
jgi:hypothetical protein